MLLIAGVLTSGVVGCSDPGVMGIFDGGSDARQDATSGPVDASGFWGFADAAYDAAPADGSSEDASADAPGADAADSDR